MSLSPQLQKFIEQSPQTFERYLIFAFIHSSRFYLAYRDSVCPYQEDKWRRDFATARYNDLYQAIDMTWRSFGDLDMAEDFGLDKPMLLSTFFDNANRGGIDEKVAKLIVEEIENDFYRTDWKIANVLNVTQGPGLAHWLNVRLTKQMATRIHNTSQMSFMTADDIQMVVAATRKNLLQVESGSAVNMGDVLMGSTLHSPMIKTGIKTLDTRLGGGYSRGTATMIAGINAGGKSVLAMQSVWNAVYFERNTVLVTTEEPPRKLVRRIVSNVLNIPIGDLITPRGMSDAETASTQEISNIPAWIWEDPELNRKLTEVHDKLLKHCCCLDWSQGQGFTIPGNFDNEIDKLVAAGWDPEMIVFDWIGGGLEQDTNKDKLRHLYQEAADSLVTHAKRTNRIVIAMAQLDKAKATGKPRTTMAMLSECKTMTNNFTNFIGLSAMQEPDINGETSRNLAVKQFMNVEKARDGSGGLVAVEAHFKFQRFKDKEQSLSGGGP